MPIYLPQELKHKRCRFDPWVMKITWSGGLVATSCPTLETSCTVALQVSLSMGFPRQEYWSGLLFPSPGDLPHPGIETGFPPLQADSLLTEREGKQITWSRKWKPTQYSCLEIPWTENPGGLQSKGWKRVRHD